METRWMCPGSADRMYLNLNMSICQWLHKQSFLSLIEHLELGSRPPSNSYGSPVSGNGAQIANMAANTNNP